jgi:hypothetical protein
MFLCYHIVIVSLLGYDYTKPDGKTGPSISTNNGRQIRATAASLDLLAQQLSMQLVRPVRNDTGIQGQFDFTFNWTPDSEPSVAANNSALGSSIFTAIGDQLGLRLNRPKVRCRFMSSTGSRRLATTESITSRPTLSPDLPRKPSRRRKASACWGDSRDRCRSPRSLRPYCA